MQVFGVVLTLINTSSQPVKFILRSNCSEHVKCSDKYMQAPPALVEEL